MAGQKDDLTARHDAVDQLRNANAVDALHLDIEHRDIGLQLARLDRRAKRRRVGIGHKVGLRAKCVKRNYHIVCR